MDNSNTLINKINLYILIDDAFKIIEKYKILLIAIYVIFFIFAIMTLMIVFYISVKILDISLDKIIFFYDYNKLCKKMLQKYGECEINKIYLIRTNLTKFHTFITNVVTLYKYNEIVKKTECDFPYHVMIVVELKLTNNRIKWILLEKNNCISMNDNFILTQGMEVEEVIIKKEKKINLNEFLEETRNRTGNEKFFNWNVFENNCQEFTKQLLITIESYSDYYEEYIFNEKIMKLLEPSKFAYCMFNFLFIFYNFLEKYIFELDIFN